MGVKVNKVKHFIIEALTTIIIAALITIVLEAFVVDNRIIPTSSMYPTIYAGDMVLVNKFVFRFQTPERGDIIVFEPDENK